MYFPALTQSKYSAHETLPYQAPLIIIEDLSLRILLANCVNINHVGTDQQVCYRLRKGSTQRFMYNLVLLIRWMYNAHEKFPYHSPLLLSLSELLRISISEVCWIFIIIEYVNKKYNADCVMAKYNINHCVYSSGLMVKCCTEKPIKRKLKTQVNRHRTWYYYSWKNTTYQKLDPKVQHNTTKEAKSVP